MTVGGASRRCDRCGAGMRAADAFFDASGELLCAGCGEPPAPARRGIGWRVLVIAVTVSAPVLYALSLR
ncbi:MAG: hypothetical protein M5U28_07030 [Sandaracinaceae bacterium]|nr:hypothetical protein [Sandaracinaceae bacterium]